ncbi:hypothetical protein [Sphingomonas sp. ID0503]|uniref:hypothetical protein n=1 Tax=Sphingomonas sp. ID0503 TaxID=3399691 RepID=UPI003AFAC3BA
MSAPVHLETVAADFAETVDRIADLTAHLTQIDAEFESLVQTLCAAHAAGRSVPAEIQRACELDRQIESLNAQLAGSIEYATYLLSSVGG